METLLIGLALASCAAWLYTAWAGARTLRALPELADDASPAPPRWPRVSLIVPACDEAAGIEAAVASKLADDYPDLEVLAVDDRSTDATGAILDTLAARDGRLTALHVRELPEGWLGKVHAQALAARRASGDWLLFSDADVHLSPGSLRRAVALAEARGLDMLAVLPEVTGASFALQIGLCAFMRGFALGRRVWAVEDPRSSAHVGVGAFNLVRRSAFERTAGFEWLRLDVADDVAMGLLMKRSGARCGVANGVGCVSVAWYRDLPGLVRGLEKNTFAVLGCSLARTLAAALAVLVLDLGAWVSLLATRPRWLAPLALAALLPALAVGLASARRSRLSAPAALLAPLGSCILAWILVRSGWLGARRGGVLWRGTLYPSAVLRAGRRVDAVG